ncbi:hypothetical protein D9M70_521070 [compost metagenome]
MLVQIQVVLGVGILDLWREEAPDPVHRQADAGLQVSAITVGTGQAAYVVVDPGRGIAIDVDEVAVAQITIETHELGLVTEVQTGRSERQDSVERDLRQSPVRGDI